MSYSMIVCWLCIACAVQQTNQIPYYFYNVKEIETTQNKEGKRRRLLLLLPCRQTSCYYYICICSRTNKRE